MGGYFPGPLGIAAAGIKFAGYAAAAAGLKKIEPVISASVLEIAGIRGALGIVLGFPATLVGVFLLSAVHPKLNDAEGYLVLGGVRVVIWALLLFMLAKPAGTCRPRLWILAIVGAAWSCLLDRPAIHLASAAPGQIPVC